MILGLDFDGVLHPMNDATAGRFCRLPLLEAWLREHNGVDVVITSSWREANSLDELRSHFVEDLRQRVVGVTPLAHRLFGPAWSRTPEEGAKARYVRQAELEAWRVEAGRDSESWFALDDDPALFEPECPKLVVCESDVGLTVERLAALNNLALPSLTLLPEADQSCFRKPAASSRSGQTLTKETIRSHLVRDRTELDQARSPAS